MNPGHWQPSASLWALKQRAGVLAVLRNFFAERGVLEVQTPVLMTHTVTDPHIDSLTLTSGEYLQSSPEYAMKRLLAAGAPSIYQLGPVFRAGESGRLHNPEFTMLEWYRLGFDDAALMTELAELVDAVMGAADYATLPFSQLLASSPLGAECEQDLRISAAIETLQA
ncbi:MAG: amino acid--tRNA ligase-related protein, partial [Pseudomonadales bacterium]